MQWQKGRAAPFQKVLRLGVPASSAWLRARLLFCYGAGRALAQRQLAPCLGTLPEITRTLMGSLIPSLLGPGTAGPQGFLA